MSTVVTLTERKAARAEEIRAGFERLRGELADYGRAHGGQFWIYGSAAPGRFHFESGIDILVEFDDAATGAAIDFIERRCSDLRLKADMQPKAGCTRAFLEKISKPALVLP